MRKITAFLAIFMFLMVTLAPAVMAEVRLVIQPMDNDAAIVTAEGAKAFSFTISGHPVDVVSTAGPALIHRISETSVEAGGFRISEFLVRGAGWKITDPLAMDENGKIGPALIIDNRLPVGFALAQNYPNPFNPETEISFQIPESGRVRLDVYNAIGQKVRTLVDEVMASGTHNVMWNATDDAGNKLTSGMYIGRLSLENQRQTIRMVLLK